MLKIVSHVSSVSLALKPYDQTRTALFASILLFSLVTLLTGCSSEVSVETTGPEITPPVNMAPSAVAGPDQSIEIGNPLSLNGSGTDPEGQALTYIWELLNAPPNSDATLSNGGSSQVQLTPDVEGKYFVQLVVNDGVNDSQPDTVVITAEFGNIAPVAVITASQTVIEPNNLVTLDGLASSDGNSDDLSYRWSIISPSGSKSSISNLFSSSTEFTPDIPGKYTVQLIVNDGELDSIATNVTIIAATFSLTLSWLPSRDDIAGYVIYAGGSTTTATKLVRILVRGAADWNPTQPSIGIDSTTILNSVENSNQICFAIKSYNGVGLSVASDVSCVPVPVPNQ